MSSSQEDLSPFSFSGNLRRPPPGKIEVLNPLCVGATKENVHNLRKKEEVCYNFFCLVLSESSLASLCFYSVLRKHTMHLIMMV